MSEVEWVFEVKKKYFCIMKSFLFFVRHQDGGGVIFEKCLPLVFSSSLILLPVCDELSGHILFVQ